MIQTKHQRIGSDLRAKIVRGVLKPGQALPTQTQLMSEYDVAQGTVRQALDRLAAEGLVVAYRGKGTFVAQPGAGAGASEGRALEAAADVRSMGLLVLSPVTTDSIFDDQFLTMERAASRLGYGLRIRVVHPDDEPAAAAWALQQTGVVIWGAATVALLEQLQRRGLPVVFLGEPVDGECPAGISSVRYDLEALIQLPVKLLADMGHRRLWFLNRASSAYFRQLSQVFAQAAADAGLSDTCREVVLETPDDEPAIVGHLDAAGADAASALLIEGDIRACRIIYELQSAGWPVPERISVLALGSAEAHRLGVRDLYRVNLAPDQGVTCAARALVEMIEADHVVRHTLAPRLLVGRTCVPPARRQA